jgi:large subunit ribosomal protein L23
MAWQDSKQEGGEVMDKTIVLRPRMSEKTYMLAQTHRTYVVDVPADTSKDSIAKAVAAQFGVTVENVNVINVKGKTKRTVRKGGRPTMGKRSDVKKAYVTLKEGDKLPFFAEIEEEAAKAEKAAKKEKK